MSTPCEQKDVINEMMVILGGLKELPNIMREFKTDLKEMMVAIQTATADGREYRTLIQQNRKDIEELHKVDHEQWEELASLGKRFETSCQRAGERIEQLERWQAALNGGKPNGLGDKIDTLATEQQQRKGREMLWKAVPVVISALALIVALMKATPAQ